VDLALKTVFALTEDGKWIEKIKIMNNPKSKIENIVVQDFENEVLIYDLAINRVFCLNETATMIYRLCDGKKSIGDIAELLSRQMKEPITEDFVWLALDGFKRDNLLANSSEIFLNFNGFSRREMIRRAGLATMAALPLVIGVIAPTAAQAQSDLCFNVDCNDGNVCTFDSCDQATGNCIHTPIPIPQPPDACTIIRCDPAIGIVTSPRVCDDNNPDTVDTCNPLIGCVNTPIN
jgi:hypothetical protein